MLGMERIFIITIGILLVGLIIIFLIIIFLYYSFSRWSPDQWQKPEPSFSKEGSSGDSTDSDDGSFREGQWLESEPEFEEEGSSGDSTDSDDGSFREGQWLESEPEFEEEGSSEDSTDLDDESFREGQWLESEPEFEEEGSSEDSTDLDDESFREKEDREIDEKYRDLVFDRVLAWIVDQVDGIKFEACFCESKLTVPCYLKPELYSNVIRPVIGGLIRLEYNIVLRVFNIIELLDSQTEKGPPSWVWNALFAEIIGEDEYMGEQIIYVSLETDEVVVCKVADHLRNTNFRDGDIVYLEVNERDRSFYKILEIVDHYDS